MTRIICFCVIATLLSTTLARCCPSHCSCFQNAEGRNAVECRQGGLNGTLSLEGMDLSMEILKITAPEDNLNSLTMNPTIQSYKKLEEVHITRSNIPNLGTHFFWGLNKLEVLNLSQNNITQPLDHNFRGLHNLKELYLDDNKIYSLPSGTFRDLRNLATLSIERNRMQELMPRVFQQLGNLRVLKLSGNSLVKLNPEVFKDIKVSVSTFSQ